MKISNKELIELADKHVARANEMKKQGLYDAYNYHYGRADSYRFLAGIIDLDDREGDNDA